jgi:lipoyl(octanoyl) transferase
MIVRDLGTLPYNDAWKLQEEHHARVAEGGQEVILLVEHPPVVTLGRRATAMENLLASSDLLQQRGVELVQTDRGGDITFHGPGQIVAYPIVRLIDHKLSVGGYVHGLEMAVIGTLAAFGIGACVDPAAVGVWTSHNGKPGKVCAIGVRVKKGITLHGLALNVTTDLSYFDLIVPCGLVGRGVTSLSQLLGEKAPSMDEVKRVLVSQLVDNFSG